MTQKILYLRTDIINQELIAGGSVSHTTGVIEGFLELQYEVVCASSIMIKILKNLNVEHCYELKNPRIIHFLRWKLNCLLSNIFFTWSTLKIMRQHKITILYQRYSILNFTGILISKFKRIPLILEYNGSEFWIEKNWTKKKWFNINSLIALVERININYAHYIVVVSEALKDELTNQGVIPSKILVNPNGVNPEQCNPDKFIDERSKIRKKLTIDDKFVFGFIGTFSQWHGIEFLGQTMPKIIEQNPKCHFLLIGDGPLLEPLKKQVKITNIEKYVTFPGLLDRHEAKEYLASCDAFLSPTQPNLDGSRFFGSPTKLFEYMSFAKPIIATDLEQISEVLYPAIKTTSLSDSNINETGFLIPPLDKQKFIETACFLMNLDKKAIKNIGNNARIRAINNYSWLGHVKKIEKFSGLKREHYGSKK